MFTKNIGLLRTLIFKLSLFSMSDESLGTSTAGELEAMSGSTSPGVSLTSPTEPPHAKKKKVEEVRWMR